MKDLKKCPICKCRRSKLYSVPCKNKNQTILFKKMCYVCYRKNLKLSERESNNFHDEDLFKKMKNIYIEDMKRDDKNER